MARPRKPGDSLQSRWPRFDGRVGGGDLEQRMIVTYRDELDGRVTVVEGIGHTISAALAEADSQLPPGLWRRLTCSTVLSIYLDLLNNGAPLETGAGQGFYSVSGFDQSGSQRLRRAHDRGEGGLVDSRQHGEASTPPSPRPRLAPSQTREADK